MQAEIPEVTCCKPTWQVSDLWVFSAEMLWGRWRIAKHDGSMLRKQAGSYVISHCFVCHWSMVIAVKAVTTHC